MNEAKLVHSFDSKNDLSHVEARDVLCKDLVFDEHGHQVTARQKLHEHVKEGSILERRVQLDNPWTVGLGENVTLRANVGQLVLFDLVAVSLLETKAPCPGRRTISCLTSDFKA